MSSGSSRFISFGEQIFTPCEFECHANKSSSKNWKISICCHGKPLLNFIELYESPDGKKHCRFVASGLHFVLPDFSVVIRSQQDDSVDRNDSNTGLTDVSSQHSITPDEHIIYQNSGNCDSSPVFKPPVLTLCGMK